MERVIPPVSIQNNGPPLYHQPPHLTAAFFYTLVHSPYVMGPRKRRRTAGGRPDKCILIKCAAQLRAFVLAPRQCRRLIIRTNMDAESVSVIAQLLRSSTVMTTLDLQGNNIGPEGAAALAGALRGDTTLTTLRLQGNNIGPEGAAALAGALRGNTILVTLNLSWNSIGPGGAAALAGALRGNTTLTTLDLPWNNIAAGGVEALAGALRGNVTLTTLWVGGSDGFPQEGSRALAIILCRNMRYREQDQATVPIFSRVVRWVEGIHSVNSSRIYESRLWLLVAQYAFTTPKGRKDALRAARSHTQ